jgi:hypothetical protein
MGFSLQANVKTREGSRHADRNAQFELINRSIKEFQDAGQPTISVDTKKKELVGDFKNPGRELRSPRPHFSRQSIPFGIGACRPILSKAV